MLRSVFFVCTLHFPFVMYMDYVISFITVWQLIVLHVTFNWLHDYILSFILYKLGWLFFLTSCMYILKLRYVV